MDGGNKTDNFIKILDPKKEADKEWFLSLLDDEKQRLYEESHLKAVLIMLRATKINALKKSETGILVAPRHTPSKIDIIKATIQIVINISSFLFFSVEIVCEYFIAFTPSRIGFVMEKCLIQYYISSVLDR